MLMFARSKKELAVAALVLLLIGIGVWLMQAKSSTQTLSELPDRSIIDWQLEGQPLTVEVVNTPTSITQGLSGRKELATDGMLFVLPEPIEASFWMKDMYFPIDIIWIADEKVVGIERNVQPPTPGTPTEELELFTAPEPVEMVLETNPGWWSE